MTAVVVLVVVAIILIWLFGRSRGGRAKGNVASSRGATTSTLPSSYRSATVPAERASRHVDDAKWYGASEPVSVAGYVLPGLVYVGAHLSTPQRPVEPSLINPKLRVNSSRPDTAGAGLDYWPSYDSIAPETRAAYLEWLAGGRRHPSAPLGFVFLFMYGLERRVLIDMQGTDQLDGELAAIRAEVAELIRVYAAESYSFQRYSRSFLEVIDMMMSATPNLTGASTPPQLSKDRWNVPFALKVALGEFAANGTPVPAAWALVWAWFTADFRMRTGASRCTDEFAELFMLEYAERFGEGLKVTPGSTMLGLTYHAASAGIGFANLKMKNVPDVFEKTKPIRALIEIAETTQESLEGFSRFVGKYPEGRGSLAGLALLPERLIAKSRNPELEAMRAWLDRMFVTSSQVSIDGVDLLQLWRPSAPANLTKMESTPLVQLLSKLNVGIEPDVRFGGAPLTLDGTIVLFQTGPDFPLSPSPAYDTATTLTHLAAAVSTADGEISDEEVSIFLPSIQSSLDLTQPERVRLAAHFSWLTSSPAKLTGLTKRVAILTDDQRVHLGGLLVSVAAADGQITPSEMTALTKIFGILGLDQTEIASRAFAAQAAPAREPITVRVAGASVPGVLIPSRPEAIQPAPGVVILDGATIARTMNESASVSELLRGIFDDPDEQRGTTPQFTDLNTPDLSPTTVLDSVISPRVPGLDESHSSIVRGLMGLASLPFTDFEEQARARNLMPMGAIDTINEAAFDIADEPLFEGDDILAINPHTLQEMLK